MIDPPRLNEKYPYWLLAHCVVKNIPWKAVNIHTRLQQYIYIQSDIPQIAISIWQFNPCESLASTVYTELPSIVWLASCQATAGVLVSLSTSHSTTVNFRGDVSAPCLCWKDAARACMIIKTSWYSLIWGILISFYKSNLTTLKSKYNICNDNFISLIFSGYIYHNNIMIKNHMIRISIFMLIYIPSFRRIEYTFVKYNLYKTLILANDLSIKCDLHSVVGVLQRQWHTGGLVTLTSFQHL